jgi:hypothetical protein
MARQNPGNQGPKRILPFRWVFTFEFFVCFLSEWSATFWTEKGHDLDRYWRKRSIAHHWSETRVSNLWLIFWTTIALRFWKKNVMSDGGDDSDEIGYSTQTLWNSWYCSLIFYFYSLEWDKYPGPSTQTQKELRRRVGTFNRYSLYVMRNWLFFSRRTCAYHQASFTLRTDIPKENDFHIKKHATLSLHYLLSVVGVSMDYKVKGAYIRAAESRREYKSPWLLGQ